MGRVCTPCGVRWCATMPGGCAATCGRWFRGLRWHLRVHGYTARDYREAVGLCATEALVAHDVSHQIARRQSARYHASKMVRERLGVGQEMARSGELRLRARAALTREAPPHRVIVRRTAREAGRRTRARERQDELGARLAAFGYPGGADALGEYLRIAYADGASLKSLGAATGLGRARLRAALVDAGGCPASKWSDDRGREALTRPHRRHPSRGPPGRRRPAGLVAQPAGARLVARPTGPRGWT